MSEQSRSSDKRTELHLGGSLLLAILIGGVFFYLATRTIPVAEVADSLAALDWTRVGLGMAAFIAVYALCHGARVVRWYFLVRPLGDVDAKEVHRVCAVGFMAILLVPLRLGEFVRPFLLAHRSRLSAAGIMATVVVERVIDGLIITGLLFVGLWTYQGEASVELARGAGTVAAAIFIPALVMAIVAYHSRQLARKVVMATLGRISTSIGEKVATLLEQFATGFAAMTKQHGLIPFLGITAIYWSANVFSMWLFLRIGFGIDIGVWEMVTVMSVLVVGIMVPAGPAMAGNFEYFLVHGMGLYVPIEEATTTGEPTIGGMVGAFAVLVHLLQIAVIVAPGVWIMVRHRQLRIGRQTLQDSKSMADDDFAQEEKADLTGQQPEE